METIKKCEVCGKDMILKMVNKKNAKNYGELIAIHKNKKFCSKICQIEWQKKVKWEDRVGEEVADRIRKETSIRVSGEKNPSCNEDVAKKISESLKSYLKDNPRLGEDNPFFGKTHTEETKNFLSELFKDKKMSEEHYEKLMNTRRYGEDHHNWNGGSSFDPYDSNFNSKIKKEIKNLDNNRCSICGKHTQKLSIHHIDYCKKNSIEENLVSLCFECHGKTNFNRSSWIKFFENYISNKRKIIDDNLSLE